MIGNLYIFIVHCLIQYDPWLYIKVIMSERMSTFYFCKWYVRCQFAKIIKIAGADSSKYLLPINIAQLWLIFLGIILITLVSWVSKTLKQWDVCYYSGFMRHTRDAVNISGCYFILRMISIVRVGEFIDALTDQIPHNADLLSTYNNLAQV